MTSAFPVHDITLDPRMAAEVRAALRKMPPSLPSKLFYDERGSRLFEAITRLPEYYQTRTEEALLAQIAEPLVGVLQPVELLELGAGVARKLTPLLESMSRRGLARRCLLLDVDDETLRRSVAQLQKDYPACEYTRASFVERLHGTGLRLRDWYTDPERLFALALVTRGLPPQGR